MNDFGMGCAHISTMNAKQIKKSVAKKIGLNENQFEIREVSHCYTNNNQPALAVWYLVKGQAELKCVKM